VISSIFYAALIAIDIQAADIQI
jgi:hypothetical protein